jgi:hypothetical protein
MVRLKSKTKKRDPAEERLFYSGLVTIASVLLAGLLFISSVFGNLGCYAGGNCKLEIAFYGVYGLLFVLIVLGLLFCSLIVRYMARTWYIVYAPMVLLLTIEIGLIVSILLSLLR